MTNFYIAGLVCGSLSFLAGSLGLLALRLIPVSEAGQREIERRKTRKEEAHRRRKVAKVARALRRDITAALTQMGYSFVYERHGATAKMSKVIFKHILYTDDGIWMRVHKLPFRVSFTDLCTPESAQNLSLNIGRKCTWIMDKTDIGVWLRISLKTGVHGIPRKFPWFDTKNAFNALESLPKTKPFVIAMGAGENRQVVTQDVRELPHLIVAGATGGGKSVFLNQMLCTLLSRNKPSMLKILLVDLKGGLEFGPYEGIPHLQKPVVYDRELVPEVLSYMQGEKRRRFELFREAGVKDIRGYNGSHKRKIPYVFLVFDEIANLMLDRQMKGKVENMLTDLAAQGRALGLHLILCSQIPKSNVINTLIKGNIPNRIAFSTDEQGSMAILDNAMAKRLPPGGRCIFKHAAWQYELQAPLIEDKQIEEVLQGLRPSLPSEEEAEEDRNLILFRAALRNHKGKFSYRLLYDDLHGTFTQREIKQAGQFYEYNSETQAPVIDVDGQRYILKRVSEVGGVTRRLVAVNGVLP